MTAYLLSAFTVLDLAAGLYLVRYSGGAERKRPEVVLLLVLAAGFLLAVVVRLHSRPVVVHERAPAGTAASVPSRDWSLQVDVVSGRRARCGQLGVGEAA